MVAEVLDDLAKGQIDLTQQAEDSNDAATQKHNSLHDVGPDYGFDAAEPGIGHRDDTQNDDRGPHIQPGRHIDGDGGDEQPRTTGEQPAHQKNTGGGGVGGRTEAIGEVAVHGVHPEAVEGSDKHRRQDEARRHRADGELQVGHITGVPLFGGPEKSGGADLGGHHGKQRRPPGNASAAEKIVIQVILLAADPEPHTYGGCQICGNDKPVESAQSVIS